MRSPRRVLTLQSSTIVNTFNLPGSPSAGACLSECWRLSNVIRCDLLYITAPFVDSYGLRSRSSWKEERVEERAFAIEVSAQQPRRVLYLSVLRDARWSSDRSGEWALMKAA
jgi:hypothetical protein